MFSASLYTQRRDALRAKVGSGLILLLGNEETGMNYGANVYPFRQDSSFLYFTGLDRASLAAVLDCDSGTDTVFGNELTIDDIVWTGPMASIADSAAKAGIQNTGTPADLQKVLADAKAKGRKIHFLPPYRAENALKLADWLGINPREAKSLASEALIHAVVGLRSYKSDEEVAEIERAVRVTNAMHLAAMRQARPGMKEAELVALVKQPPLSQDSETSFPVILTVNGQVLHQHGHHGTLDAGRLCLVDCGSESLMHYAGDMTRTFPVDPTFTTRQKDVYQVCLDSQLAAIDTLKPGFAYRDSHLTAAKVIASGLKDLGLMKGDVEEAVAAGAHALFFVHGLGHMMGLDVHDMEDLGENFVGYNDEIKRSEQFGTAFLRLGRKLEPGFVITVEPGIYFIPELIDMWRKENKFADFLNYDVIDTYKNFGGIRIEDDLVITQSGARLLGDPVPKTVAEVEAIRQG